MIDAVATRASESGRLAIDTEFMSERHYQSLLCLVQVAVPDPQGRDGVRTEVLDPLGQFDPEPLAGVLADPGVEVVVHAGRQDVALLRRTWGTDVTNVFDTQVAAGFLGYGLQEGYKQLVRRVLEVKLPGTEAFTRWDRRPLTERQLEYARADAAHLLTLGAAIDEQLVAAGRRDWAREECRSLEGSSDERDADAIYERLPRVGRLKPRERAVAHALVQWREQTARSLDRTAASVLPDHVLVELARAMPATRDELAQARGMPGGTLQRRAGELLQTIERGKSSSPPPAPPEPPRVDPRQAPMVALAQAVVRQRALESQIATELIATQSELVALVGAVRRGDSEPLSRVLAGWRRELVGAELLEVLGGRRQLRVGADGQLAITG